MNSTIAAKAHKDLEIGSKKWNLGSNKNAPFFIQKCALADVELIPGSVACWLVFLWFKHGEIKQQTR